MFNKTGNSELSSIGFFGGSAFIATILSLWNTVQMYLSKFYGLFIIRITVKDNYLLTKTIKQYLITNFKCKSLSSFTYIQLRKYVRSISKNRMVLFKDLPDESTIYWRNYKPLFFKKDKDNVCTLFFLRWTYVEKEVLKDIENFMNEIDGGNIRFYTERFTGNLIDISSKNKSSNNPPDSKLIRPIDTDDTGLIPVNWNKEDLGQPLQKSPLEHLALNDNCLEAINEAKRWIKSENWFKEHLVPHKRGWLLYGKPGTGKTSFIRGLAQELNIPILIFDLSTMSNKDFQDNWSSILGKTPCIVLFEDLDAIFDKRLNMSKIPGALTFDCFLNCIDGIENTDGVFIIVTTNKIESMDPAIGIPNENNISTRPGRIDRAIEMTNPDQNGRRKIANRILKDFSSERDKIVKEGDNDTGAQFQERCARLALKLFWEQKDEQKNRR
jgi:hypothetical protein